MADEPAPSFNQQLRTLKKGKSLSVTERYPVLDLPLDGINDTLARMRRTINAAVSRVRDPEAGSNFRVESAAALTNDNEAVLATVCVTRI